MITIHEVSKSFLDNPVIESLSLNIAEGEHLVLLGPSGSGKTTLLRMINGLIAPSSGSIMINGQDIREQCQHGLRRQIGYVLQRNSLFPHYSVEENISAVPKLLKWNKQVISQRVKELMRKLNLPEKFLHKAPDKLSGGEAQRVNIARALAADPPILLMDEPFSALDAITRRSIRREFKQLDEFQKKTIIIVTHDIQEAFDLGDTIVLLQHGKLIQHGRPSELLYNPSNRFVKEFLSNDYLQLSFTVTSIADLWEYLPEEGIYEDGFSEEPVCCTTLWDAMVSFGEATNDGKLITVQHEKTGGLKRVTWSNLMSAYGLLQNNHCG